MSSSTIYAISLTWLHDYTIYYIFDKIFKIIKKVNTKILIKYLADVRIELATLCNFHVFVHKTKHRYTAAVARGAQHYACPD